MVGQLPPRFQVIEAYPLTALIFCGSLLTLVFGVLNMIAACLNGELCRVGAVHIDLVDFSIPIFLMPGTQKVLQCSKAK